MKTLHVEKYYSKGIKMNGLGLLDYRDLNIEFNVTKTAEGSARVTMGKNIVIAGVKMELAEPYPDTPDEGSLMVDVQLTPMASEHFEHGPPGIDAIELARVTDRSIRESGCFDNSQLVIKSGEQVWNVLIDVTPINADGSLFGISQFAAVSALLVTRFPSIENDMADYKHPSDVYLKLKRIPVTVTVYKYKNYLMVDPTPDDLKYTEARLSIATIDDGTIVGFQKGGDGAFTQDEVKQIIQIAIKKGKEIRENILKQWKNYMKKVK